MGILAWWKERQRRKQVEARLNEIDLALLEEIMKATKKKKPNYIE